MKKGFIALKFVIGIVLGAIIIFASAYLFSLFLGSIVGNPDDQATIQSFERFVQTVQVVQTQKVGASLAMPISIGKDYQIIAWPKSSNLVEEECMRDESAMKPIKCGSYGCMCLYKLTYGYSLQGQDITSNPNSPVVDCVKVDFDVYGASGDSNNNGAPVNGKKYAVFTGDLCGIFGNFGTKLLVFKNENGYVSIRSNSVEEVTPVVTPSPTTVAPLCFQREPYVGQRLSTNEYVIKVDSGYVYLDKDKNSPNGVSVPYRVGGCSTPQPYDPNQVQPPSEVLNDGNFVQV